MRSLRIAGLAALLLAGCGGSTVPVETTSSSSGGVTSGHSTGNNNTGTHGSASGSGASTVSSGSTSTGSTSGSTSTGSTGSTGNVTDSGSSSGATASSASSGAGTTSSGSDSGSTAGSVGTVGSTSTGTTGSTGTTTTGTSASSSTGTTGTTSTSTTGTTGSGPANDLCANATVIRAGQPVSGTTLGAHDDYSFQGTACTGTFTAGPDVVYAFTAPLAGNYTFTLVPNGWDGELYVLTDCSVAAAGMTSCVAGADTAAVGGQEQLSVALTQGQSVRVVVDSYGAVSSGDFTLSVSSTAVDRCGAAQTLAISQAGDSANLSGVTSGESANDSLTCGGYGPELAYTFTTSVDLALSVHLQGSLFPDAGGMAPVVYVQEPCGLEQAEDGCNGGQNPGDSTDLVISHLPVGTHTLWVDSRQYTAGPFTGTVSLSAPIPPPANDSCAGTVPTINLVAQPDGTFAGSAAYDTTQANDTITEPNDGVGCYGYTNGADVVFALNVPSPMGGVNVTATGATSYQAYFVLQGPTCSDAVTSSGPGSELMCADIGAFNKAPLPAGTAYLWVDGPGAGTVTVTAGPPPANDSCEGTVPTLTLAPAADGGLFASAPYNTHFADSTVAEPNIDQCFGGYDNGGDVVFALNLSAPVSTLSIATDGVDPNQYQAVFLRAGPTCSDAEGAGGGAGTSLYCSDYTPTVTGALAAGTYYVWIDGPGAGTLTVTGH